MIWSDGKKYRCDQCQSSWPPRQRYLVWPIRVSWRPRSGQQKFFSAHGVEIGSGVMPGQRVEEIYFKRVVRVGPVVVVLGDVG